MKTIQERAKRYASKKAGITLCPAYDEALARIYEEGYISGAEEQRRLDEEQRRLDISRAFKWFLSNVDNSSNISEKEFIEYMMKE